MVNLLVRAFRGEALPANQRHHRPPAATRDDCPSLPVRAEPLSAVQTMFGSADHTTVSSGAQEEAEGPVTLKHLSLRAPGRRGLG